MSDIAKVEFLFSISNVMIYEMKPKGIFNARQPTYFWRVKDNMDINGPFNSIFEAIRHWERTTMHPIAQSTNVIKVDFRAKKRIK